MGPSIDPCFALDSTGTPAARLSVNLLRGG
jgi:hypothetical protein